MSKQFFNRFKQHIEYATVGSRFDPLTTGYVYVIGPHDRQYVKIGKASSPWSRLADLQIGSWEEIKIHALVAFRDDRQIQVEHAAHRVAKGRGHHVRGEWFQCSVNEALDCIIDAAEDMGAAFHPVAEAFENFDIEHAATRETEEDRRKKLRVKLGIDETEEVE